MEALMTPSQKEQFLRQDDYLFNKRLSRSSSCCLVCNDEVCVSRFHRACEDGRSDLVGQFLEFCRDPDCRVLETDDSPLHLTLYHDRKSSTELLLRAGADPNLANSIGWTPLHALANRDGGDDEDDTTTTFFKILAQRGKVVAVDARDDLGRTPLECAVASLKPNVVDALLEHGRADLANFRFPRQVYFSKWLRRSVGESRLCLVLRAASGMMAVMERLKRHGYPFDHAKVLFILKLSGLHGLFNAPPEANERWHEDERFQRFAKTIAIRGDARITLYALLHTRAEDATKLVSYEEYARLAKSPGFAELPEECQTACAKHLCAKLTRKFFLAWATECLMRVAPSEMSQEVKLELCERMLKPFRNTILYRVCLAAERGLLRELAMFEEMKIDEVKLDSLFSRNKIVQD